LTGRENREADLQEVGMTFNDEGRLVSFFVFLVALVRLIDRQSFRDERFAIDLRITSEIATDVSYGKSSFASSIADGPLFRYVNSNAVCAVFSRSRTSALSDCRTAWSLPVPIRWSSLFGKHNPKERSAKENIGRVK
jgi:hypothetical protein